jgi:hypothetical protein
LTITFLLLLPFCIGLNKIHLTIRLRTTTKWHG